MQFQVSLLQAITVLMIPLPFVGFWFWMFRDMMNNVYLTSEEKNDWMIKFLLLSIFAAYWYYQIEYKNRNL